MKKWILSLWLLLVLLLPAAAQAQTAQSLSELEIDLWPEYDRPGVLVIYRLTLSAQTVIPAQVSVRIPAAVGEPYAVAARQAEGALFNLAYERVVSGEWASIIFTATSSEIQLEYYDNTLSRTGDLRSFTYTWPGDFAIQSMVIQVQQPLDASNMRISPSFGAGVTGGDGLVYYDRQVGQVNADQTVEISFQYTKSTDTFSAQSLTVRPSGEISQGGSNGLQPSNMLWLVFGLLGAALIVGGVLWYRQTGRQAERVAKPRRGRRASARKEQAVMSAEEGIYCHRCGKRAQPGDRFCRSCGTALRIV
jgi:hypothetical protein